MHGKHRGTVGSRSFLGFETPRVGCCRGKAPGRPPRPYAADQNGARRGQRTALGKIQWALAPLNPELPAYVPAFEALPGVTIAPAEAALFQDGAVGIELKVNGRCLDRLAAEQDLDHLRGDDGAA